MRVLTIVSILFLLYSCENSSKKNPKSEKKILQSSVFKSLKFDSAFLSSTIFLNGDKIQQAQSAEDWKKFCASKTPAWCYVDQKNKKGFLYNYYVLSDTRGIIEKSKCITKKQSEKLIEELSKSNQNLIFDSNATIQRAFYGSNCDLGFVQFWIFDNSDLVRNKAYVMVFDLKSKQFRMDAVSVNNGFRIWSLK